MYETPHKRLSDFGRGLCAAGIGFLLSSGVWFLYHRFSWMRTIWAISLIWLMLWAARIPFTFQYYNLRQRRFDYPIWGDSMGIPIASESIAWIIGAVMSLVVLGLLFIRRRLPDRIIVIRPDSAYGWIRAGLITCWMLFLCACVATGIPDGDEGMVLTGIVASVILMAFLAASKVPAEVPQS